MLTLKQAWVWWTLPEGQQSTVRFGGIAKATKRVLMAQPLPSLLCQSRTKVRLKWGSGRGKSPPSYRYISFSNVMCIYI